MGVSYNTLVLYENQRIKENIFTTLSNLSLHQSMKYILKLRSNSSYHSQVKVYLKSLTYFFIY